MGQKIHPVRVSASAVIEPWSSRWHGDKKSFARLVS